MCYYVYSVILLVVCILGGLPYGLVTDGESSTPDTSLIANITCSANEQKLSECVVNMQTQCQQYCSSLIGLYCYSKQAIGIML